MNLQTIIFFPEFLQKTERNVSDRSAAPPPHAEFVEGGEYSRVPRHFDIDIDGRLLYVGI